jgi:hypothetical protein
VIDHQNFDEYFLILIYSLQKGSLSMPTIKNAASSVSLVSIDVRINRSWRTDQIDLKKCFKKLKHSTTRGWYKFK